MCAAHQQYDEESDAALLESDLQPSLQRRVLRKVLVVFSLVAAVALMSLELDASHRPGLPARHDSLGPAVAARERVMLESGSEKKDSDVSKTKSHNHTQVKRNVKGSKKTKIQMPTPRSSAHVVSTVLHKNTHNSTELESNVDDDQAKKMHLHTPSTTAQVVSRAHNITQDERNVDGSEAKKIQLPTPSTAASVVSAALLLLMVVLSAAAAYFAMKCLREMPSFDQITCSQVASACVAYAAGVPPGMDAQLVIEVMLAAVQPGIILASMVLYTRFGVDKLVLVPQVVILVVVTLRLVFADLPFMRMWIHRKNQQQPKDAQIDGDERQGDASVAPTKAALVAETQREEGNAADALLLLLGRFQIWKSFVFSKAEAIDVVTDATAVVSVLHLQRSASFQLRLVAGWSQGPAALLLPIFELLTLAGTAAFLLVLATSVQTLFAVLILGKSSPEHMAEVAEGVGLGGFSSFVILGYDTEGTSTSAERRKEEARYFRLVAKVFFEAAPQLVLQGSAVMASGTGLRAQPVLATSLLFSAALGCDKVWTMLHFLRLNWKRMDWDFCLLLYVTAPAALSGFMIIWGVGRVFAAEQCASKIWNLSTGCVVFP
eukprot:TRINITY_DN2956_c0_g1_i1.p1 TRINITY_DN2956_c0_g1~~TRINITY_DN2956_c0_g1_i1.p1  ORF type:complete len:603 (+),score=132.69 TRINITY_DN2956_c0_g1_i1:63-1871(+)